MRSARGGEQVRLKREQCGRKKREKEKDKIIKHSCYISLRSRGRKVEATVGVKCKKLKAPKSRSLYLTNRG